MTPVWFALGTCLSTFAGGVLGIRYSDRLHQVISFTAGVLIGVTFFDVVPEMVRLSQENGFDITHGFCVLVGGFVIIHAIEKVAVIHSSHESEYADHRHPTVGYISSGALCVHSFLDGVGIALGFHANTHLGVLIAVAVIAHDFTDGLNTVSIMLLNRHPPQRAFVLLVVDAIAPLLGVVVASRVRVPDRVVVLYLGLFAGFLLYIGASDLLPEAHSKHSSWALVGLTVAGIVLIFLVTRGLNMASP